MSTDQVLSLIDCLGDAATTAPVTGGGFYGLSRPASSATLAALEPPGSLEDTLTAFSAHEQRLSANVHPVGLMMAP